MREWVPIIWLLGIAVYASLGEAHLPLAVIASQGEDPAMQIDHVILAITDLEAGIREFEHLTGVKPAYGGSHPDRDTHNAIASLSGGMYIEILAPKDELEALPDFFKDFHQLTLVGFAISTRDIERVESTVRALGLDTQGTESGSRMTPDGGSLAWRLLLINEPESFMNPFFISWSEDSDHPSKRQPPQGDLKSLRLTTLHKKQLERILSESGSEVSGLTIVEGARKLTLELETPKGRITFESSSAPDSSESAAVARGELLVPRYGLSAATDGRWVYVYGGAPSGSRNGPDFMHQGLLALIERVDPISLESTYFSNGLHRRANHGSVAMRDSLVSCGGRTQVGLSRFRISSCEILDLETGVFRELPALPEPLRTLGLANVDGDLYAVGGLTEQGDYSTATLKLGHGATAWERLEDMPFPREGKIVSVGHRLYAIGGYNGSALRSVLVFDTKGGNWERREDLPYPLSAFSAVSDDTAIYLFGDYQRMSAVHKYDPRTGRLELLDLEITPRRHADAVLVDGRVLVIGGNQKSSGPATRVIESFELEVLRTAPRRN